MSTEGRLLAAPGGIEQLMRRTRSLLPSGWRAPHGPSMTFDRCKSNNALSPKSCVPISFMPKAPWPACALCGSASVDLHTKDFHVGGAAEDVAVLQEDGHIPRIAAEHFQRGETEVDATTDRPRERQRSCSLLGESATKYALSAYHGMDHGENSRHHPIPCLCLPICKQGLRDGAHQIIPVESRPAGRPCPSPPEDWYSRRPLSAKHAGPRAREGQRR